MPEQNSNELPNDLPRKFQTTRWSIVAELREGTPRRARAALEELCQAYWYPVYSFVRRRGLSAEDALDVTQAFFVTVVEREIFSAANPERGRLRSFLLKSVQNHLISRNRSETTLKRSPVNSAVSLDQIESERRFHLEPRDEITAERAFERQWALTVIERAVGKLRLELESKESAEHAELLMQLLTGQADDMTLEITAEKLATTAGALKVRNHRIRGRYRELLRYEIADTVGPNVDVDEELRILLLSL